MVYLTDVQYSNSLISSTLPPGLIAIFVGATSGIGEATIKEFAKKSRKPRAYLVGRSQAAAERIIAECKTLNPGGEYIFIQSDVSLIRNVDEVCKVIKEKEKSINILFLSAGVASLDRGKTSEQIHLLAALTYYSRVRFMLNLLPLIQRASHLRRVVTVAGGSREGPIDTSDFPALQVPLLSLRGHLITLITLGLEAVARTAPDVSFVHDYPGTVNTPLIGNKTGVIGLLLRTYIYLFGRWVCVPIEESGERHLFLATSARFPSAKEAGKNDGVKLQRGVEVAEGTTRTVGSGVYSVGWDCESAGPKVWELLAEYREKGVVEEIWRHTESEFERIAALNERL